MARDRANIRTNIWADEDFRTLIDVDQFLYFQLLAHPELNYAGVMDWRPGKLSMFSANGSVDALRERASRLEAGNYILIDEVSEEVLVRSFLKHDGLMKQPKLAVAMANAFAGIGSLKIRQVVAFEVQKLKKALPDLSCWEHPAVQTVVEHSGKDIREFTQGLTPEVTHKLTPIVTLNAGQRQAERTTTTTTTLTSLIGDESEKQKPRTKLPDSWSPTAEHISRAKEHNLDLIREVENFRGHAETHDRRVANWNSAFTTWLRKAAERKPVTGINAQNEWMFR